MTKDNAENLPTKAMGKSHNSRRSIKSNGGSEGGGTSGEAESEWKATKSDRMRTHDDNTTAAETDARS